MNASAKPPPAPPSIPVAATVRAARSLFLREGFGVGMDAIAAEAGVSKVTVYNHFGNKETLFVAVIAGALDEPPRGPGDPPPPLAR
ncbi:helix-turn-helix domain-containing protein [Streptomyces sp. NPDC051214]|uniref:TetR/AcrR family transcriptional regulator n=1 Tax=Streptomyces sp. NPDC051214 TaxID=3155282 RepID=UPI0034413367